jgi:hypothetical protein
MGEYQDLIPTCASLLSRRKCSDSSESWRVQDQFVKRASQAASRLSVMPFNSSKSEGLQVRRLRLRLKPHDSVDFQLAPSRYRPLKVTLWRVPASMSFFPMVALMDPVRTSLGGLFLVAMVCVAKSR